MKKKIIYLLLSFAVGISSVPAAAAEPAYSIDPREMNEQIPALKKEDSEDNQEDKIIYTTGPMVVEPCPVPEREDTDTVQQPETPTVGEEDKSPTDEEIKIEIEKKWLEESANAGKSHTDDGVKRSIEQIMKDAEEAQKKEMGQKDDSVKKQLLLKTSKNRYTVKKGKTVRIKAYSSNGRKVTFKSNKRKIASVDSCGKVKGLKKGTVKVSVQCGSVRKTVLVIVK